jgi:N-methylhydantoinase A
MSYAEGGSDLICGVDIGGTFTDAVLVADDNTFSTGKAETDRADLAGSVLNAIEVAAWHQGIDLGTALKKMAELVIGSTIGTNFLLENKGTKVGLVTTSGFEDTLQIMRGGYGRTAGKPVETLGDPHALHKPSPRLIDRNQIVGVSERVTRTGQVLVPLDEEQVREAGRTFRDRGVEAIAICFLWSVRYPDHERRAKEILLEECSPAFVCCSSELSSRTGEYERTVATVLNALLGPPNAAVTTGLSDELFSKGCRAEPMFLNCSGGVLAHSDALTAPLLLVDSGPAGGVAASLDLAHEAGDADAVLCDMGGTSFDVGIVWHSTPLLLTEHIVGGYSAFLPRVDITSIGAGGGSIAWVDRRGDRSRLRVGPQSAGAFPGPAAYARGGQQPTVTDANLLLGNVDPVDYFGPDTGSLDMDAATAAVGALGAELGLTPVQTAASIIRIVDQQSADFVRQITIKRGLDLAKFALYVYGGSGPLHAGGLGRALGVRSVCMPTGALPAVWSAFGAATADMVRIVEEPVQLRSPWDLDLLNAAISRLRNRAGAVYAEAEGVRLEVAISMGYVGQAHSIELPLEDEVVADGFNPATAEQLTMRFFDWYDERYGHGFSYRTRATEVRDLRCRAVKTRRRLTTGAVQAHREGDNNAAARASRDVWWPELGCFVSTPLHTLPELASHGKLEGPAVVTLERSALLIHPGQSLDTSQPSMLVLELGEP